MSRGWAGILIAVMASGCGSTAPAAPTAVDPAPTPPASAAPVPAPASEGIPSLRGHWTGSGSIEFSNSSYGQPCATLALSVSAQDMGAFSGSMNWQGGGADSDRRCAFGGTFTGTIAIDRTFTLRLNHNGTTAYCKRLSGESVFTGTLTADERLQGQMTDRAACSSIEGSPVWEADRTYRFNVRLICAPPRCQVADAP